MTKKKFSPVKRGRSKAAWGGIACFLGMILIGYPPCLSQGVTRSTPTGQPTIGAQRATNVSAPTQAAPRSGAGPGAKAPVPAAGSPAFATPKDLPSKGSPGAKLVVVMFTEFH